MMGLKISNKLLHRMLVPNLYKTTNTIKII